jgi:hypothetical protein
VERRVRRVGALSAITALWLSIIAAPAPIALASAPAAAGVVSSSAPGQPLSPSVRGVSRLQRSSALRSSAALTAPAAIQALTDGHHSDLLANFDGVGSLDSKVTNFDLQFEPPDQGLCVGNGFVVEMVNSAFRIFDTKGNTLAGPTNINQPFQDGFAQFTSDPRCVYDRSTNTWFATILFLADDFLSSRLEIAFNTSGDPTTPWSVFKIDTTHTGGPGCPCFGDQPTLGMDASNLYVTTNEFSINGPPFSFNGAQIYAFDKHDLVSGEEKVHFVHYGNLFIGGEQAVSVQPAMTYGPAGAEYFLSALGLNNGAAEKRIGVWALTNVSAVGSGRRPTLSSFILASEAYAPPPAAIQKGSTSLLDTGDDRMQQTQFIDGEIWGALDTQVRPAGDTVPRAGAAWFRVKPHLVGSRIRGATMAAQGYVLSEGQYVMYPAIQADGEGHAAMVFTLTGATRFASAAYAVLSDEGESFGRPKIAAAGTGPYDPNATRWGDYSWVLLDTTSHSIWMATEYMPPLASQSPFRNWGTRVLQLSLDEQQ